MLHNLKFIFDDFNNIGINNIKFVLPVIHDWNNSNNSGETTRFSSLIALNYYQWFVDEKGYISDKEKEKLIIQTILFGASEIKSELEEIVDKIIQKKWKKQIDPYYQLSTTILTKFEGFSFSQILPDFALKIAELFWKYDPISDKDIKAYRAGIEIEQYFGLERDQVTSP